MAEFKIVVVGAGPVGLAAAAALANIKPKGDNSVSVTVFDRSEAPLSASGCASTTNAQTAAAEDRDPRALEIWPNAIAALQAIPTKDHAHLATSITSSSRSDSGYKLERYDFRSPTGQLLWGAPTGSIGRRLGRAPYVLTPRQLRACLQHDLPDHGRIKFEHNSEVTGVEQQVDGVRVSVRKSKGPVSHVNVDFLVGADGASSLVRDVATIEGDKKRAFPATDLRTSRIIAVVGRAEVEPMRGLTSAGIGFVSHMQDARFGAWACPASPTTHVRWLALVPSRALFHEEMSEGGELEHAFDCSDRPLAPPVCGITISEWSHEHHHTVMHRLHKCLGGMALSSLRLLDSVTEASTRVFTLFDAPPKRNAWFTSHIALVGDAVHPTLPDLGQGCGLAFEDVESLARRLQGAFDQANVFPDEDQLIDALRAWRDERHTRASFVVQMTRALSEAVHAGAEPQRLRDATIATFGPTTILPSLYAIVGYEPPRKTH